MRMRIKTFVLALLTAAALAAGPAAASLEGFKTFVGNVGVSTDGFGSLSSTGVISASVPVGSTVLGAYLYTACLAALPLWGMAVHWLAARSLSGHWFLTELLAAA